MRRAILYICVILSMAAAFAQTRTSPGGSVIEAGDAFIRQLTPRDSILIADQVLFGFGLKDVSDGTLFGFPDLTKASNDTITVVRGWKIDTLKVVRDRASRHSLMDMEAGIVIAPFEEGVYHLPPIAVQRILPDGRIDTLVFKGVDMEVKTMPVDTATFVPHDIKGQIRYPLTFAEILPYLLGFWALALIVTAICCIVSIRRKRESQGPVISEPAHIVALRKLDKFRSNKYWAPEKQKVFYSGITDTVREYIESRYGIDALNMTTAEIFESLKDVDIDKDLLAESEELFERADLVKFAKYTADDSWNAAALPTAVRFVTSTYQSQVEEEAGDVL